jgi:hypothetical protein
VDDLVGPSPVVMAPVMTKRGRVTSSMSLVNVLETAGGLDKALFPQGGARVIYAERASTWCSLAPG